MDFVQAVCCVRVRANTTIYLVLHGATATLTYFVGAINVSWNCRFRTYFLAIHLVSRIFSRPNWNLHKLLLILYSKTSLRAVCVRKSSHLVRASSSPNSCTTRNEWFIDDRMRVLVRVHPSSLLYVSERQRHLSPYCFYPGPVLNSLLRVNKTIPLFFP